MFSRRDLIVALAPHLFGQDPRVLDRLVERALADPEVVPLVGCGRRPRTGPLAGLGPGPGDRHRRRLARQLARADAPAVPRGRSSGRRIGRAGHRRRPVRRAAAAAGASAPRGAGAELVVGVAGAGKTTMLRAVADAFERAGCQVIGTATSGQAARNLGHEAEIGESRTLASLHLAARPRPADARLNRPSSSSTRWA